MLVLTAQEMAGLDYKTINETGIPGIVLMENAAQGAAAFFLRVVPDLLERRITVLAGSGNNAGDGFALARIFHSKGAQVSVLCLRSPNTLSGDALTNYRVVEKLRIAIAVWNEAEDFEAQRTQIDQAGAIIDAILGTGLKSEVRGLYRKVIESVNKLNIPILSVDIPSGLDATSGKPLGAAIRATATATFGFLKIGHVIEPGAEFAGVVEVVDIGIPQLLVKSSGIERHWLTEEYVSSWVEPRPSGAHKGFAGHACVLAGSLGKTGAASLLCLGAARAGAGLVTLFVPESLNHILEVKLTEPMTFPIPETNRLSPALGSLPFILDFLKGKQVLAMGPGISTHEETVALVKELVLHCGCPMVLDADAITALSDDPAILRDASGPVVLTPHPGEMARLCHCSVPEVQQDRFGSASRFSSEFGVVLLLKGHRTIIAAPDGKTAINSTGNPAMACGGMGDTLTGIIAGLIAQGYDGFKSACLGAYVHGAASDRRIKGVSSRGLLATDMLDEIPYVIGCLEGFRNA